jgi:D-serine deaminase-like pyridoxal phosphate-dependent protein
MTELTGADRTLRLLDRQVGRALAEVETPVAVIDLDRTDQNLERMQRYAGEHGIALWPHTKTHKSVELARRALDLGADGLTIAKSGEAEVMAQAGSRILSHYPPLGDEKCARLAALARDGVELTVALDGPGAASGLSRALAAVGASCEILIELDVGLRRTGVADAAAAVALARHADAQPGLRVTGISCYPGHLRSPESLGGLAQVDELLREVRDALEASGIECTRISGGSTPSRYRTHTTIVNELRSGSYIFLDRSSASSEPDGGLEACALWVEAGVVSVSSDGRAVIDAGSKTLTSDPAPDPGHGAIVGMPEARLHTINEEHGYLDVSQVAEPPRFGDHLQVIPNHACGCVNMHDGLLGVRGGIVERVVRVDARGLVR